MALIDREGHSALDAAVLAGQQEAVHIITDRLIQAAAKQGADDCRWDTEWMTHRPLLLAPVPHGKGLYMAGRRLKLWRRNAMPRWRRLLVSVVSRRPPSPWLRYVAHGP